MFRDVEVATSSGLSSGVKDDGATHDDKALAGCKRKDDHLAGGSSRAKVFKKPYKILPCPLCDSSNTKFCYYNNHNANQPRHFCKNCQRYWTSGGAMRNILVGAGLRRPEFSHQEKTHSGYITAFMQPLMADMVFMKSGPEIQSYKPVTSMHNLEGQEKNDESVFISAGKNGDDPPCSSPATPNIVEAHFFRVEVHKEQSTFPGCCTELKPMHPSQDFLGTLWPYSMSQGCNAVPSKLPGRSSEDIIATPVLFGPQVTVAAPAWYVSAILFPLMSSSFWAGRCWPDEVLTLPWKGVIDGLPPSFSATAANETSSKDSPMVGKHSRDGSLHVEEKIEKSSLWVPKTLRLDDPEDAAKSSMSTLGITLDESIKRGNLFRSFHAGNEVSNASSATRVLHFNPAAMSRSQTFQERA